MSHSLCIQSFCLGEWRTNCYVLHPAAHSGHCWLVDAGFQPQPMIDYIHERNLQPRGVLLTHAHVDHIAGLHDIRLAFPHIPILIHQHELSFLTDAALNLSAFTDSPIIAPQADETLSHGQSLSLDGIVAEVRHTPGHSPGGITLYHEKDAVAIVGDTLFAGSIGRYDFPTSDGTLLLRSIREQLLTLPDHTRVLPGHGPKTTIGDERRNNPFLQDIHATNP